VHIGYRKTGSTWLQNVAFQRHPALATVPAYPIRPLELMAHPLLRELVVRPDREFDPAAARSVLIDAVREAVGDDECMVLVTAERLSGHGASGGYDSFRIARRLHASVPEAKVFWFVREQVSAIRAEYKHMVIEGWPGTVEATLAARSPWATVGFDLGHWEYHHLVETYQGLFGAENVRVFDYGRLRGGAGPLLDELAGFLGLDPWDLSADDLDGRVNVSGSDRYIATRRILNHVTRSELNPYPPITVSKWLRSKSIAVGAAARLARRPLFPADFDQSIAQRYGDSNKRLAALTGIEFSRR
jgi:hypothetical protein